MTEELPGSPNRRCDGCANATTATRLAPSEPVLCAFCVARLDHAQMQALDAAGWTTADPTGAMTGETRDLLRRELRVSYLRLLLA